MSQICGNGRQKLKLKVCAGNPHEKGTQ